MASETRRRSDCSFRRNSCCREISCLRSAPSARMSSASSSCVASRAFFSLSNCSEVVLPLACCAAISSLMPLRSTCSLATTSWRVPSSACRSEASLSRWCCTARSKASRIRDSCERSSCICLRRDTSASRRDRSSAVSSPWLRARAPTRSRTRADTSSDFSKDCLCAVKACLCSPIACPWSFSSRSRWLWTRSSSRAERWFRSVRALSISRTWSERLAWRAMWLSLPMFRVAWLCFRPSTAAPCDAVCSSVALMRCPSPSIFTCSSPCVSVRALSR
mmetsp:Transcript_43149/g.127866  ORF Transcript_43149/g.127866 Transcript_43149/m.127866 type:complete len:276 (+) Transcript_43149:354-1181(+)